MTIHFRCYKTTPTFGMSGFEDGRKFCLQLSSVSLVHPPGFRLHRSFGEQTGTSFKFDVRSWFTRPKTRRVDLLGPLSSRRWALGGGSDRRTFEKKDAKKAFPLAMAILLQIQMFYLHLQRGPLCSGPRPAERPCQQFFLRISSSVYKGSTRKDRRTDKQCSCLSDRAPRGPQKRLLCVAIAALVVLPRIGDRWPRQYNFITTTMKNASVVLVWQENEKHYMYNVAWSSFLHFFSSNFRNF